MSNPGFTCARKQAAASPDSAAAYHRSKIAKLSDGNETARLILVTGMTPTRAGEGKTVTSIGLT